MCSTSYSRRAQLQQQSLVIVQIITHWQHSHSLCMAWRLCPIPEHSAWAVIKLGKGRDLVPCRATTHTTKVSVRRHIPLAPLCQSSFPSLLPVCSLTVHQDPTLPHHPCRMCYQALMKQMPASPTSLHLHGSQQGHTVN